MLPYCRYYRHALKLTTVATESWSAAGVAFVCQLGDIIDGQNKDNGTSEEALRTVGHCDLASVCFSLHCGPDAVCSGVFWCVLGAVRLIKGAMLVRSGLCALGAVALCSAPLTAAGIQVLSVMDGCSCKKLHVIGNHELYNFDRANLAELGLVTAPYSSFKPHDGWRFIVIDAFDISTPGWDDGHPNRSAAWELLRENNPNTHQVSDHSLHYQDYNVDWMDGVEGLAKRWNPNNGAVGDVQLAWLVEQLGEAVTAGERVILLSHVPVQPGSCNDDCLLWNYETCLEAIYTHGAGNVVAVLAGHDHTGGYKQDAAGIHHVTFCAPVEAKPPLACHAQVDVHGSRIVIRGFGTQGSFELDFPTLPTLQHSGQV